MPESVSRRVFVTVPVTDSILYEGAGTPLDVQVRVICDPDTGVNEFDPNVTVSGLSDERKIGNDKVLLWRPVGNVDKHGCYAIQMGENWQYVPSRPLTCARTES